MRLCCGICWKVLCGLGMSVNFDADTAREEDWEGESLRGFATVGRTRGALKGQRYGRSHMDTVCPDFASKIAMPREMLTASTTSALTTQSQCHALPVPQSRDCPCEQRFLQVYSLRFEACQLFPRPAARLTSVKRRPSGSCLVKRGHERRRLGLRMERGLGCRGWFCEGVDYAVED